MHIHASVYIYKLHTYYGHSYIHTYIYNAYIERERVLPSLCTHIHIYIYVYIDYNIYPRHIPIKCWAAYSFLTRQIQPFPLLLQLLVQRFQVSFGLRLVQLYN